MRRGIMIFLVAAVLVTFMPHGAIATQTISIVLDGNRLYCDQVPFLVNGRVVVPLRPVFEALGAAVSWDSAAGSVVAVSGQNSVQLIAGNIVAYRNACRVELDVPATLVAGTVFVPIRFISEALGAEVQWDAANRIVRIERNGELESRASEQVKKYLSLLDRAQRESVAGEDWEEILSQEALMSGYGTAARVYRPNPAQAAGNSDRSIYNVEIVRAVRLSAPEDEPAAIVVAQYVSNDPSVQETARRLVHYEKEYALVWEDGRLVIDREQVRALRLTTDIPLTTLSEKDVRRITEEWQQANQLSYGSVLDINNQFVSSTLSAVIGMTKWGNTTTAGGEAQLRELLGRFSPAVLESDEWDDFLSLPAKRDPVFTVIWAASTEDTVSVLLLGDLFPGFDDIPALMEVEIERQPGDPSGSEWSITRLERVKSYDSLADLKREEPHIYEMILNMDGYRRALAE